MAEQEPGSFRPAAPFPLPPPFYKHFTESNLQALEEKRAEEGVENATDLEASELPVELRNLLPPAPPADGLVNVFGQDTDVCCTVCDFSIPLY